VAGKQANSKTQQVRKRQVFYIPGYDPMLPRRYRELYRSEGALQADISGYQLDLKGNPKGDNYSWSVRSTIDGLETSTRFEFLLWSDIVQSSMDRSIPATFLLLARLDLSAHWRLEAVDTPAQRASDRRPLSGFHAQPANAAGHWPWSDYRRGG